MGPLHLAAVSGKRRYVRELLAGLQGQEFTDRRDPDGLTAFALSVLAGQFKVCERIQPNHGRIARR